MPPSPSRPVIRSRPCIRSWNAFGGTYPSRTVEAPPKGTLSWQLLQGAYRGCTMRLMYLSRRLRHEAVVYPQQRFICPFLSSAYFRMKTLQLASGLIFSLSLVSICPRTASAQSARHTVPVSYGTPNMAFGSWVPPSSASHAYLSCRSRSSALMKLSLLCYRAKTKQVYSQIVFAEDLREKSTTD